MLAHIARLLLIILVAGLSILVHGYTSVDSDEPPAAGLPAQADALQSTPQPTALSQDLAQEIELLKIKVESEMEASRTGIDAMKEVNDRNFYLFAFISGVAGLFGLGTLFKARQEHRDYQHERQFYENRARHSEDRSQAEHKAIIGLYGAQIKARQGENERSAKMFTLQQENLKDVNIITTAIAEGAQQNVASLNTILSTFQQIMEFKVVEAEETRTTMERMKNQLDDLQKRLEEAQRRQEEVQSQQVEELLASAKRLRRPRHIYTSPSLDLKRQIEEFRNQVDLMPQVVLDQYTGVKSPEKNRPYGEIYLRRGIIAYYDNDVFKSRNMLETAERFYSFPGQEVESIPEDQKLATAFIQFYLALIQKNYGKLTLARDYIEKSYMVYGKDRPEELLTPVTRAEILSYLPGEIDNARAAIHQVLERAGRLQQGGSLEPNDANSALRARLLLGNTYYVEGKWEQALQHYQDTLETGIGQDSSYYVYHSIAQVYHRLGDEEKASEYKRQAYDVLIKTEHLATKVALDTQILLNALAYLCTRDDQPQESEEYKKTIRKLWLQIVEISGLELRLFSFEKKRPISKDEFWTEVFS